jgi:saccharopine dehydrogenase-like NADP-dependent oxidoreductase
MGSIVVLGGAGGVGAVATRALGHIDDVDEVVVADARDAVVASFVEELGDARFRPAAVDVTDSRALSALVSGADVVLNCVGPFYRFGPPTLATVIEAGVGYVDVCDDLSATEAMLELDGAAREAGVLALIGMGNSPGLANVFVKMCAEQLLDEVTSVDIMHIHGGEPDEGPAVLKHRVHAMVNDVPLYVDGRFVDVRQLDDTGAAFVRHEDFPGLGVYPVFPYPHPETITLPTTFTTLRRATNLGVVFPLSYFTMTQDLVRAGMGAEDPIPVPAPDGGVVEVSPIDVMVALLRHERPRLLAEAGVDGPAGALRVVVGGRKGGEEHVYTCTLASTEEGAGEGTGIPAALGAVLHLCGQLDAGPGVHAPEAAVPVNPLLDLAGVVVRGMGIGGGAGMPLQIDHVGPDGSTESMPLTLG